MTGARLGRLAALLLMAGVGWGCNSVLGIVDFTGQNDGGTASGFMAGTGASSGASGSSGEAGAQSGTTAGATGSGNATGTGSSGSATGTSSSGNATGTGSAGNATGTSSAGNATATGSSGNATGTGSAGNAIGSGSSGQGATCTSSCTAGPTQCTATGVQSCQAQGNGCTAWVTTTTCGANQTCSSDATGATCTCKSSACTQTGSVCEDEQTLATCMKDANGCYFVASTSTCPAPKVCSGMAPNAACSLTCQSSCAQGQSSCVTGSLATCTLGTDGCFSYGSPVACGQHRSCTGAAGSGACTCNTDSVCQNTAGTICTSTTASATCSTDPEQCIYQSGSATCTNQTCVSGTGCTGACGPGQTTCLANAPQSCGTSGQWQASAECSGATPFCVGAACAAEPPSCAPGGPGMSNCGAKSEGCCTSPEVVGGPPASPFYRTYSNSGGGATGEADPASVSSFRLDKYDVTVGRFRQFVAAWNAGWTPPAGSGKHTHLNGGQGLVSAGSAGEYEPGWVASDDANVAPTNANLASCSPQGTWTSTAGTQENLPVNCVNWSEAYAFCIWDAGFLPSEAEWEYAAAGGSQQLEYPWGATQPGMMSQYAIYDCYFGPSSCNSPANLAPVGTATLGVGPWGQLDLAGDVSQWNLDGYGNYVTPCTDCASVMAASLRTAGGGDFDDNPARLLPPVRGTFASSSRSEYVGFRCARSP